MAVISRRISDRAANIYLTVDDGASVDNLDSNPNVTRIGQLRVLDGMPKVGWLPQTPVLGQEYPMLYDRNDIQAILEEMVRRECELVELSPIGGNREWIFR